MTNFGSKTVNRQAAVHGLKFWGQMGQKQKEGSMKKGQEPLGSPAHQVVWRRKSLIDSPLFASDSKLLRVCIPCPPLITDAPDIIPHTTKTLVDPSWVQVLLCLIKPSLRVFSRLNQLSALW